MKSEETNSLIRYRLEQARTALDDAQGLMDINRSPESIINRSYYAMFYSALALLQTIGQTPAKHSGVISLINREFVLKGLLPRQLGKDLHEVFDLRLASDYQITSAPNRDDALSALKKALNFFQNVLEYLKTQGFAL